MSKTQNQSINENESNSIQVKRKSKFNKFFSTVTAVMIASSLTLGPMTLRGEDMNENQKKEFLEKVNKYIETKENELKEKIKENDKKIEEAKKKIEENNKAIEEENKKLLKKCNNLKNDIVEADEYCKKNSCSKEDLKMISESKELYKKECVKLIVKSE